MAERSSPLSELDGPTAWRILVTAIVLGGIAIAYVRTGSVVDAIVLGVLGALLIALGVAAMVAAVRTVRSRLGDGR